MTKFFNLESYLECCQYAQLFGTSSDTLIPPHHSLPLDYKNFYHQHYQQEFLPIPVITSSFPSQLKPRENPIIKHTLGFSLNDNNSEQIFMIREANSLILRALNAHYLYSNVYRYWSYVNQFKNYAQSNKPIIIYDFDSFTPQQITPLTFENLPNSPYPIPIIDTRNLEKYQSLNININYEDIYNNICEQIAYKIIRQCQIDIRHRQETIHYLKAINIFSHINHNTVNLPLLIKIDNRYYQYNVDVNDLAEIIWQNFPLKKLGEIVNNNQAQYNFVILTHYSRISSVYNALSHEFIIPNTEENNFDNIWEETRKKQFPLYGQHLDNISFFVRRKGEDKDTEISLPSQICYEGEKEVIVYGEYLNNQGIITNEFSISTSPVFLPFTINQQLLINDVTEKEQIYQIINQYFDTTPELKIKIRFRLQPGLNPKLEIIDQFDRILTSSLLDRSEITLAYIPYDKIYDFRQEISQKSWAKLSTNQDILREKLELWQNLLNIFDTVEKARQIHQLRLNIDKYLPIIYSIENDNFEQQYFLNFYKSLESLLENNLSEFSQRFSYMNQYQKNAINNAYGDILLFLGKSYSLTQNMSLAYLFNESRLTANYVKSFALHLQNIARISCTLLRQKQFINLFNLYSRTQGKEFYKLDNYLWGYARILVWYFNFNNDEQFLDYEQHFEQIITYSLTLNPSDNKNKGYLQNALITLIYLLTFRQYNSDFVKENSPLYHQAKKLCQNLQYHSITTSQVKINIPLNEFFEKILDGNMTGKEAEIIITI